MIYFQVLCFFLLMVEAAQGQTAIRNSAQPALPTVFLLGEYENQYEGIVPGYQSLLEACDNDMNIAFEKLMSMMQEMEAYAGMTGYDLKGVNAWMHFFWREDGSIEHIGFYLKPNSKNVNTDGLKNFLNAFTQQYKFPLKTTRKYAHYSSFSFPVMLPKPVTDNGKSTAKKNTAQGNNR